MTAARIIPVTIAAGASLPETVATGGQLICRRGSLQALQAALVAEIGRAYLATTDASAGSILEPQRHLLAKVRAYREGEAAIRLLDDLIERKGAADA